MFGIFCAICKASETIESLRYFFNHFQKTEASGNPEISEATGCKKALDSLLILQYSPGKGPSWLLLSGPFSRRKRKSSPLCPHPVATCPQGQTCFLAYLEHGDIVSNCPLVKKINKPILCLYSVTKKALIQPRGIEEECNSSTNMYHMLPVGLDLGLGTPVQGWIHFWRFLHLWYKGLPLLCANILFYISQKKSKPPLGYLKSLQINTLNNHLWFFCSLYR